MPDRIRTNVDDIIRMQHSVIKNLRLTLSTLLDELEAHQDESDELRKALDEARQLVTLRYPIDRPTHN